MSEAESTRETLETSKSLKRRSRELEEQLQDALEGSEEMSRSDQRAMVSASYLYSLNALEGFIQVINEGRSDEDRAEAAIELSEMLFGRDLAVALKEDRIAEGRKLLYLAATAFGSKRAKELLDKRMRCDYCLFQRASVVDSPAKGGPLQDFDGNVIVIDETGPEIPVDAQLCFEDGVNLLTLTFNVSVWTDDGVRPDIADFLVDGFLAWEGDYKVFNNQDLRVRVSMTMGMSFEDSVHVFVIKDKMREGKDLDAPLSMVDIASYNALGMSASERAKSNYDERRSFVIGSEWSVSSKKAMYLFEERLADKDEATRIVAHEFGHILGLGDLYMEISSGLMGVEEAYPDLEPFSLEEKSYATIMDKGTVITNNDIEMVILAYARNRAQLYQSTRSGEEVSEALGRGN